MRTIKSTKPNNKTPIVFPYSRETQKPSIIWLQAAPILVSLLSLFVSVLTFLSTFSYKHYHVIRYITYNYDAKTDGSKKAGRFDMNFINIGNQYVSIYAVNLYFVLAKNAKCDFKAHFHIGSDLHTFTAAILKPGDIKNYSFEIPHQKQDITICHEVFYIASDQDDKTLREPSVRGLSVSFASNTDTAIGRDVWPLIDKVYLSGGIW